MTVTSRLKLKWSVRLFLAFMVAFCFACATLFNWKVVSELAAAQYVFLAMGLLLLCPIIQYESIRYKCAPHGLSFHGFLMRSIMIPWGDIADMHEMPNGERPMAHSSARPFWPTLPFPTLISYQALLAPGEG